MSYKMVRNFFIIFFFAALGFYRPSFLNNYEMWSRYILEVVGVLLLTYSFFLRKKNSLNSISKIGFSLIVISMFSSIYMAYKYSGQSLFQGFTSTLPYLISYLSLFILIFLRISPSFLEKMVKYFAITTMILMLVNFITFPNALFGSIDISQSRDGLLRVRMAGIMAVTFFLFYSIHRFSLFKNRKHIKWIVICSLFIILSLTRQLILLSFVFGAFLYFKNVRIKTKVVFAALILLISFFVVPRLSLFQSLSNTTNQQLTSNVNEDIRFLAWEYYTKEKQPDPSCYIWGTGAPNSNSKYGERFYAETTDLKVFIVDIGLGGFYYLFGVIGVAGILLLLLSSFLYKPLFLYSYVKIFIVVNLFMCFTSGVILNRSDVILLMISIYFLSYKYENRRTNFKLQQS